MFNFQYLANKYQLIMVDIDNTLFNYTYAHNKALQNVLKNIIFRWKIMNMQECKLKLEIYL